MESSSEANIERVSTIDAGNQDDNISNQDFTDSEEVPSSLQRRNGLAEEEKYHVWFSFILLQGPSSRNSKNQFSYPTVPPTR